MYSKVIVQTTRDTNRTIIKHNNQRNLGFEDKGFIKLTSTKEMNHFIGLLLLISLKKTASTRTRDFIRHTYKSQVNLGLFRNIKKNINDIEHIEYERFLLIGKFLRFGGDLVFIDKMEWKSRKGQQFAATGGFWQPVLHTETGLPVQVPNVFSMFEQSIKLINEINMSFYENSGKLGIDELMVKARSKKMPFRTFNAGKSDKWGCQFFFLCDSHSNYLVKFSPLWPSYVRPHQ